MPSGIEFGDAELLRVVDLREQDLGVGTAALELVDQIGDATDDEVVTQVHHEVVVAEEVAGDEHAVRQPQRGVLRNVGGSDPEVGPVADRCLDLGVGVADDDPDVGDAGVPNSLEAVEQHRLVGDRDQLLGRGVGDRPQAGAGAARQHECLHAARLPERPAPQLWRAWGSESLCAEPG